MKYNVTFVLEFNEQEYLTPGVIETEDINGVYTDVISAEYMNILVCGIPYTVVYDIALRKYIECDEKAFL